MLHKYGFVPNFLLSNGGFPAFCTFEMKYKLILLFWFEKFQKSSDHNENSYFCVFQNSYLHVERTKEPTKLRYQKRHWKKLKNVHENLYLMLVGGSNPTAFEKGSVGLVKSILLV